MFTEQENERVRRADFTLLNAPNFTTAEGASDYLAGEIDAAHHVACELIQPFLAGHLSDELWTETPPLREVRPTTETCAFVSRLHMELRDANHYVAAFLAGKRLPKVKVWERDHDELVRVAAEYAGKDPDSDCAAPVLKWLLKRTQGQPPVPAPILAIVPGGTE